MDFNLFDLMGLDNPVKEEKKEKAAPKEKKEPKKAKPSTKAGNKATIKLPVDINIPYCDTIGGFAIEGKTEATHKEIIEELQKRYPQLIRINSSLYKEDNGSYSLNHTSDGVVYKGTVNCSVLMFGGEVIPFESDSDDVDTSVLADAILASNEDLKGISIGFLADDSCTAVPVFNCNSFKDEIKQAGIKIIIPGVKSLFLTLPKDKQGFTPEIVMANIPENYNHLVPCVFKHEKEWKIIMLPKQIASTAPAKAKGFDISSGNVKVSLLFTKLDLKPEGFDGEDEVTSEQICNFIVAFGYPEYANKRCSIEKVSDDLLVAIIKSSTKGASL